MSYLDSLFIGATGASGATGPSGAAGPTTLGEGTYATRPSSPPNVFLYQASDGSQSLYDTTQYRPVLNTMGGPTLGKQPLAAASWTHLSGASTLTDSVGCLLSASTSTTAGDYWLLTSGSAITSASVVTLSFTQYINSTAPVPFGIMICKNASSVSNEAIVFGPTGAAANEVVYQLYTSLNTPSTSHAIVDPNIPQPSQLITLRTLVSGGNQLYQYSSNGLDFITAYSETYATGFTPAYAGFWVGYSNYTYPGINGARIYSFSIT